MTEFRGKGNKGGKGQSERGNREREGEEGRRGGEWEAARDMTPLCHDSF